MITIRLTQAEMFMAAMVGTQRRIESTFSQRRDAAGYSDSNGWDIDIEGAAAELAVAKYFGKHWGGSLNTFKLSDVGNYQIRSTTLESGRLIIRPSDMATDTFIFVVGKSPVLKIVGYILGADARRHEYWMNPSNRPGAWFVPQSVLSPIEQLKDVC